MTIPEMIPVESSNIRSISFDLATQELFVQFIGRGGKADSIYKYIAVPKELFERFMNAPSKGSFFASFVKSHYSAVRIQ